MANIDDLSVHEVFRVKANMDGVHHCIAKNRPGNLKVPARASSRSRFGNGRRRLSVLSLG